MKDESLLGPWVRRFLLEHLVAERNLSRNTQAAAAARVTLSWIVLRATPSIRAISRVLTPSCASRNICLICLMVSSLFVSITCSSWMITRA
jgi:hypothetical protein